jgi:outer membrane lipoprotein LolB
MVALSVLTGCAQAPKKPQARDDAAQWRGRLALRIENDATQSFFANFELSGHAQAGELLLSGPLGSAVADLQWAPNVAILRSQGQTQTFDSLQALATQATGTVIPIGALFSWLRGVPAQEDGWQADLSDLPQGRLLAKRTHPAPAAQLRLILEP